MASGKVSLIQQPLGSTDFISTLRSYRRLLLSCVGPEGGIKVLITGAGYTTYTSSSSRLLNNVTLSNPICLFINQIIKSQINAYHDHGLYTGILVASLLENILLHHDKFSVNLAMNITENFSLVLRNLFDLSCIKLKVDFSTVKQLLPMVKSIIMSKPMCGLTKSDIQNLQINIVKGFLQTVGETVGEVIVECTEASELRSQVFSGIIYPVINDSSLKIVDEKCEKKKRSLLLFNIMLTDDDGTKISDKRSIKVERHEKNNVFIREALSLFELISELNIDIVACQKVVHPELQLFLQRKGILLLERLGTNLTIALEKLSGATPVSSIRYCLEDSVNLLSLIGTVDAVQLVKCGQKNYILLEKANSNIATLLAYAPNEEAVLELKVVIRQCLNVLYSLLTFPAVVPGAGCLEMCLSVQIQNQVMVETDKYSCTTTQLKSYIMWLQTALLSAAGFATTDSCSLLVDTVFGHAWKSNKGICCCGLVSGEMVQNKCGKLIEASNKSGILLLQNLALFSSLTSDPLTLKEAAVVDSFISKQNAVKLSLESCCSLLSIGMIVYKLPNG